MRISDWSSDVCSSDLGFNVRADGAARKRIQDAGVDVRYYSIIYEIIDDVTDAVSGMLGTETREQIVGIAQVRDVFRSSGIGNIAGCLVIEGQVQRDRKSTRLNSSH